jgi:hypothetical protein
MEPMNFPLMFQFFYQMLGTFLFLLAAYTIKVLASRVETKAWYYENSLRLGITVALFAIVSFNLVAIPNFADMLGSIGLNAERSTVAIAVLITSWTVKNTTEVALSNPASIDRGKDQ